jgi:hypothetical protein
MPQTLWGCQFLSRSKFSLLRKWSIAVEGEQNAVDHCGNDGDFLPYSAFFTLFTVHYYFDT